MACTIENTIIMSVLYNFVCYMVVGLRYFSLFAYFLLTVALDEESVKSMGK